MYLFSCFMYLCVYVLLVFFLFCLCKSAFFSVFVNVSFCCYCFLPILCHLLFGIYCLCICCMYVCLLYVFCVSSLFLYVCVLNLFMLISAFLSAFMCLMLGCFIYVCHCALVLYLFDLYFIMCFVLRSACVLCALLLLSVCMCSL